MGVVRKRVHERVTFEGDGKQDLQVFESRTFQAGRTAGAKALK